MLSRTGLGLGGLTRGQGVGVPAIDLLQEELDAAGIWARLDGIYILAQSSAGLSYVNLKDPGTYDLTASGDLVFVPYSYVAGNGVDAVLGSGYQPDGSRNYKLNDAMVFAWTRGPIGSSITNFSVGSSTTFMLPRNTPSTGIRSRLNSGTTQSTPSNSAVGAIGLDRSGSAGYDVFYNGEKFGSPVQASSALPAGPLELLRFPPTSYSLLQIQAYAVGGSLTSLGTGAHRTLYRAVSRCLNRLGATTSDAFRWPLGVQTWYNSPRAMPAGDGILTGSVHPHDGSVMAHLLPDDAEPGRAWILHERLDLDDHNNPAYLLDAVTGKYLAFWSPHIGGDTYMAISTNVGDPTAWGSRISLDLQLGSTSYSYHNVIQLSAESNRIYDFFRAGVQTTHVSYTDAQDGTGWQTATQMLWAGNPYTIPDSDGVSRIDFVTTTGSRSVLSNNSVFHFYYEGGDLYKSDGTLIGDMIADAPLATTDVTLIYDGNGAAGGGWDWDIVRYSDGRIAIGYATYADITNHLYHRALWNGSAWTSETICDAGGTLDDPLAAEYSQGFYSGGFVFDRENPDIAYCSREVDASGAIDPDGVHQLFRLNRQANGSWTAVQLTAGTDPVFRPYHVKGTRKLIYNVGPYTSHESMETRVGAIGI